MRNHLKEKLAYGTAVGMSIVVLCFFVLCTWIGYEAKVTCRDAQREYQGECVDALIAQLDDPTKSYRARNNAVWALGQFGDTRAVPVLEKYYTGNIPEREPLDEMLSQYELYKALQLSRGGTNISAWIWRSFFK